MSEFRMESAQAVNAARPQESAIHSEIYNPNSKWATFEQLNANANGESNANFLEMTDPYNTEDSKAVAPNLGDSKRVDFRQNNQEHAIFDGVKDGEIDYDEYTDLQQEQNLISQAQQYFGADGFSQQELQNLELLQNSARQHILDAGGTDELKYATGSGEEEPGKDDHGGEEDRGGKDDHGGKEDHGGKDEHGGEDKGGKEDCPPEKGGDKPSEPGANDEQFQQFMKFLDQNGDGNISLEELMQAFQQMDENHDGIISPEEFQKFMEKLAEQKPGEEPPSEKPPSEEPPSEEPPSEKPPTEKPPGDETPPPIDGGDKPPETDPSEPIKGSLEDALAQNDFDRRGIVNSDAPFRGPHGWAFGKFDGQFPPKDGEINTGSWGVIYPEEGKTVDPTANVQVKDASTYYHLKGGGWVEAQRPDQATWWEGNYPADFHGDGHDPGKGRRMLDDGTYEFDSPPVGKNDHFGPGLNELKYDTSKYDGVFTTYSIRSDKENSGMVAQIGMDHKDGEFWGRHSPAFGGSNWTRLSTDWQPLYYTSLDANTFKDDPPPGLS